MALAEKNEGTMSVIPAEDVCTCTDKCEAGEVNTACPVCKNDLKIKSVIYYYLKDEDRIELPHHLKKPVTYKKVTKLWNSMK